jgi:hypothetical protein
VFRLPTTLVDERMRPGDPYLNYCHWPYESHCEGVGKLRPATLLYQAVSQMPHAEWMVGTLQAIQRGVGDFRCVYGVKLIDERWALEVYIYDYDRSDRVVSIERLQHACGGRLQFPDVVDSRIPYFMFSFDLTEDVAASDGRLPSVHVYIGNPGSDVSSGIAYEFTDTTRQLENFYFFFESQTHRQQILDKLECSAILDSWNQPIDELFRPELRDCNTICLANKRTCDTVYFSGVNIDQFLFFLNWQDYPADFVRFVRDRRDVLDHLLFDVGVDYCSINGTLKFVKHGFYGIF